jgi:hypothetical protein
MMVLLAIKRGASGSIHLAKEIEEVIGVRRELEA